MQISAVVCFFAVITYVNADEVSTIEGIDEVLDNLKAASCRKGYQGLTLEARDTIYHCAGVKKDTAESKVTYADTKFVNFNGKEPKASMMICFFKNIGTAKADDSGFDEAKLLEFFKNVYKKEGGEASAKDLTEKILACEKKHPFKFPSEYEDGTPFKSFVDCTKVSSGKCPASG